ncbi:MAG: DUF2244 domain-containing protein [Pseudomonadota bacterium]
MTATCSDLAALDAHGGGAATSDPFLRDDAPILSRLLWPNRPLGRAGFFWLILAVIAGMAVSIVPLIGTDVGLGLLPFEAATIALLVFAIRRSNRDGRVTEELRLWPDVVAVERRDPCGRVRRWQANPYWVEVRLHADARPENYLTLRGGGREIELGAFLSPAERVALHDDLQSALAGLRAPNPS